ncbi:MAG: 3',5'-cyclic-nucleotide phosphodiesterase [Planctomycetes bacterium]|nr:3',5'-cyclic-nucleotide phosphodiesterase [Planctomycetota bacterium]
MRFQLLPSTFRVASPEPTSPADPQFLTSFLVDDEVVIDAGSIGFAPLEIQRRVRHLFLSHSHMDHVASLPLFLENVYTFDDEAVTVYASRDVIECLETHLFNDRIWPDFIALSAAAPPFLHVRVVADGEAIAVGEVTVTPIRVDHVVETFGFVIDGPEASIAVASDTGPTEQLWRVAASRPHLEAVFLECSFPESMRWLADEAQHLTPAKYAAEIRKIGRPVKNYALHIKPGTRDEVIAELEAEALPGFEVGEPGRDYRFPAR